MGTEKISLYVVEGVLVSEVVSQLENELIETYKIKDKENRRKVVLSLSKLLVEVGRQNAWFDVGVAFFTDGNMIRKYFYFGKENLYWADDKFYLVPLLKDIEEGLK